MRHNLGRCALTSLKVEENWTKIEKAAKLSHINMVVEFGRFRSSFRDAAKRRARNPYSAALVVMDSGLAA
jgi:hypothetical protein